MKLDETILVTEEQNGVETKYLSNFEDYFSFLIQIYKENRKELSCVIKDLFQTKGQKKFLKIDIDENTIFHAKFCKNEIELCNFLSEAKKSGFNENKCSRECLKVLKTYGFGINGERQFHSMHYKAQAYVFKQGEVLHNLNGNDYLVLAVLNENNLLLMAQNNGQYILAKNTIMYERSLKTGSVSEDNIVRGIEWGQGSYLGYDLSVINLPGIFQEYGKKPEKISIWDYRQEARKQFDVYRWLIKEEGIAPAVKWAAEDSMQKAFETDIRSEFEEYLQEGRYDRQLLEKHQSVKKEKLR